MAPAGQRQGIFQCPPGRGPAGLVAIETENDFLRRLEQAPQMCGGRRGAQRRHRIRNPVLSQADDIHIAFDHNHSGQFPVLLACFVQTIQLASLVEKAGFGRIQVLGLAFVQHAPAKSYATTATVTYGEHDAVAETVVVLLVVFFDHQAGQHHPLPCLAVGPQLLEQFVPGVRGVPDAEAGCGFAAEASFFQIGDRAIVFLQTLAKNFLRVGEQGVQVLVLAWRRRTAFTRHFHAHAGRQRFHRLDKFQPIVFHEEAQRGAMRVAAKAVVKLLGLAHGERRCFLIVKGTASLVFTTRLF